MLDRRTFLPAGALSILRGAGDKEGAVAAYLRRAELGQGWIGVSRIGCHLRSRSTWSLRREADHL